MNPILLSNWLEICDRAQINSIPAFFGPCIKIDRFRRFLERLGNLPTLDRAYHWLRRHYQPHQNIWRWDFYSTEALKSAIALGYSRVLPRLQREKINKPIPRCDRGENSKNFTGSC